MQWLKEEEQPLVPKEEGEDKSLNFFLLFSFYATRFSKKIIEK